MASVMCQHSIVLFSLGGCGADLAELCHFSLQVGDLKCEEQSVLKARGRERKKNPPFPAW